MATMAGRPTYTTYVNTGTRQQEESPTTYLNIVTFHTTKLPLNVVSYTENAHPHEIQRASPITQLINSYT